MTSQLWNRNVGLNHLPFAKLKNIATTTCLNESPDAITNRQTPQILI